MIKTLRPFGVAITCAVLSLSACGGGGDGDGGDTAGAATTTAPTTGESTDTEAEPTTGEGGGSNDGADSDYCRALRGEIEAPADITALGDITFEDTTPAEVAKILNDARPKMAAILKTLPDEIEADMGTLLNASMDVLDGYVAADGDLSKFDPSTMENPELTAASERIEAFNDEVCNVGAFGAPSEATPGGSVPTGSLPADMIASAIAPLAAQLNLTEDQVECLVGKMSEGASTGGDPDIAKIMTHFADCDINLDG